MPEADRSSVRAFYYRRTEVPPKREPRRVKFADLPDVLTPRDLMAFLPLGRDAIYVALQNEEIRNKRKGQKYLIRKAALREYLGGEVE